MIGGTLRRGESKKTRVFHSDDGEEKVVTWDALKSAAHLAGIDLAKLGQDGTRVRIAFDGDRVTDLELEVPRSAGAGIRSKQPAKPSPNRPRQSEQRRSEAKRGAAKSRRNDRGNGHVEPYGHIRFDTAASTIAEAPSHTAHHAETKSGYIDLRLEVKTPLVVYGSARETNATHHYRGGDWTVLEMDNKQDAKKAENGHTLVSLPQPGTPLSGSALKGALRSWYEAFTGSARLMAPLAISWRRPGLDWREGLLGGVLRQRKSGGLEIVPCTVHQVVTPPPPRMNDRMSDRSVESVREELGGYGFDADTLQNGASNEQDDAWLVVSASAAGRKHVTVAVFSRTDEPGIPVSKELGESLKVAYCHLSPPDPHSEQGMWPVSGGGNTRVSFVRGTGRDLYRMAAREAGAPSQTPVWYELDDDGRPTYVSHVKGGREASLNPLDGRVADGGANARLDTLEAGEMTPADTAFGTAQPGTSKASAKVRKPYRSRVRVLGGRPDESADAPFDTKTYSLPPLEQPKPSAAGFYLRKRKGTGAVAWWDDDVQAAGTKMYYHRDPVPVDENQRRYNASTVEAVEPGAVYRSRIHFEDFTDAELGALLLSAGLQADPAAGDDQVRGWKLGLAKPIGFGSVANTIDRVILIDRKKEAANPFAVAESELPRDAWAPLIDRAVEHFGMTDGLLADAEALARHDTVDGLDIRYSGMGEVRRQPDGRQKQLHRPSDLHRRP